MAQEQLELQNQYCNFSYITFSLESLVDSFLELLLPLMITDSNFVFEENCKFEWKELFKQRHLESESSIASIFYGTYIITGL